MNRFHGILAAGLLASSAISLQAQLPSASARAFGMANNYTAAANGYDAVAWNPAALAMPDRPFFSLNLLSTGAVTGLDPVSLGDINGYSGQLIPTAVKESWLQKIGTGRERGRADGGVSLLALNVGSVGFQIGTSAAGIANLNQDASEAILFGNAGRTGTAKDFQFAGSSASGSSFVTGALSYAMPLPFNPLSMLGEHLALGVTAKYVNGGAIVRAQDNGSLVTQNNIDVRFPAITSSEFANNGSGVGMDLGVMWTGAAGRAAATIRNVFNTFAWDASKLQYRPGTVTFDGTTSSSNFDSTAYSAAPAGMRSALEAEKFKPEIALGYARQVSSFLVSADASQRIGDGIDIGPKTHVGVGAEYLGVPHLPLRAGVAAINGGAQIAGGLGLRFGPYEFGAGVTLRTRDSGSETGAMISLVSIR